MNRQTNQRVEEYLAENDVIFVGVGPTEMHGGSPIDAETAVAEAFALKMAERVDALALSGLPFLYSGATRVRQGDGAARRPGERRHHPRDGALPGPAGFQAERDADHLPPVYNPQYR